tara:strand:- start:853 stop:1362 length:510 start_codon:yes stop_codon:yes gene_type:complete
MSAQYLNSENPNLQQKIRVYSAVVKENMVVEKNASVTNILSVGGLVSAGSLKLGGTGNITLPALPVYTQLTSETTPVAVTGSEEQFKINTAASSNFNPATTRLFNVTHSAVTDNTMVLVSRAGSLGTNQQLLTWVAYTAAGVIRVALHNLSTLVASGQETLIFKLIQTG